ncbi:MAG: sterol desaturase family protein [Spirochaetota bacterium]
MDTKAIVIVSVLVLIFLLEGIFPHFRGRTSRVRHGLSHIFIAIINGLLTRLLFAGLAIKATTWTQAQSFGILNTGLFSQAAGTTIAFVLFDIWMYFWHVANHHVSLLWLFHRAHHADIAMDTTTALRFHLGELFFSSFARLPVIMLIGLSFEQVVFFETILNVSTLFHHSNIHIPEKWDSIIRLVITSPNMHRVHHSTERRETNSNYTSILSIWDRIVRTFKRRADTSTITIGLSDFRSQKWQGAFGFYISPFLNPQP